MRKVLTESRKTREIRRRETCQADTPVGGAVRAKITLEDEYAECHAIGSPISLAYGAIELPSLIRVQRASEICECLEGEMSSQDGQDSA